MINEVRLTATRSVWHSARLCIFSFLARNPWYGGIIRVYTSADDCDLAKAYFSPFCQVAISAISNQTQTAIQEFTADNTKWVSARFFSLQMLFDEGEGDVLLLDADLLFQASIEELNNMQGEMLAAYDGPSYQGLFTHRESNELIKSSVNSMRSGLMDRAFNSGLIRISGGLLGPELYKQALTYLSEEKLNSITRVQHDQFILNRIFEQKWQAIDASYNYLLAYPNAIFHTTNIRSSAAKVLHFNTITKPWDLQASAETRDPALAYSISLWLKSYADMVTTQALTTHSLNKQC